MKMLRQVVLLMRNITMLRISFLILLCGSINAQSATDTLRHYDCNARKLYFVDRDISRQVVRFSTPAPGEIQALTLWLTGANSGGCATVRLYGHEGGTMVPALGRELCAPLRICKTRVGEEALSVQLPEAVQLRNNQFFVVIENLATDTYILSDGLPRAPECRSQDGDAFYYQYLQMQDSSWQSYQHAFMVDAVIHYEAGESAENLQDVTTSIGFPDSLYCTSIAWADCNGDLFQDALVGGRLFLNDGSGAFSDASRRAGLAGDSAIYAFCDINNDGYYDILRLGNVSARGQAANLFLNDGHANFTAHSIALPAVGQVTCFSIADINGDSYPDMFLGGPDGTFLLLNNAKSGFTDISAAFDLPAESGGATIEGAMWVDYDNDADPDLFLCGAGGTTNVIYRNDGAQAFVRVELGPVTHAGRRMGGDWADYDNDGDLDLILGSNNSQVFLAANPAGMLATGILANNGEVGQILEALVYPAGPEFEEKHGGAVWGDVNNDGLLDFFVATTAYCRYGDVYVQNRQGEFVLRSFDYNVWKLAAGRDAVWVDTDNDGRLDLATAHRGIFRLYANRTTGSGNYAEIYPLARTGNKAALGSRLTVYGGGRSHTRELASGRGAAMQNSGQVHFGLGDIENIDSLVVRWPDGSREKFSTMRINSVRSLRQGSSTVALAAESDSELTAFPNPFSEKLHIELNITESGPVKLQVYTLTHQLLATVVDEALAAGTHRFYWEPEAPAKQNGPLASAVYILRLDSQAGRSVLRIVREN